MFHAYHQVDASRPCHGRVLIKHLHFLPPAQYHAIVFIPGVGHQPEEVPGPKEDCQHQGEDKPYEYHLSREEDESCDEHVCSAAGLKGILQAAGMERKVAARKVSE